MFIIIEGIDGAGKSIIRKVLTDFYVNLKFLDLKEGYEKIKKKDLNVKKDFFKANFLANRNEMIIVDRFHLSEIVYSKTLRNTDVDIEEFEKEIFGPDIKNVVSILIDAHEEVAQERIIKRDGKKYEQNLHLERKLFKDTERNSVIPTKYMIYNDDLKKVTDSVKEFIEHVCGISGKVLKK